MKKRKIISEEEKLSRILSNSAIFFFVVFILSKTIIFFLDVGLPSWKEVFEFFPTVFNSNFIIAFFTALYVLFTFKLFIATKRQAEEIRAQNEESKKPNLIVKLEPFGVGGVVMKIQNVGKGNAHDISVVFQINKEGKTLKDEKWLHTLLQPTEYVRLHLENISYIGFLEKYDEFLFETACSGDDGLRVKSPKTILDLKKFLEYMHGDKWLMEQTFEDDIHSIAKELKKVNTKLDSLIRKIQRR